MKFGKLTWGQNEAILNKLVKAGGGDEKTVIDGILSGAIEIILKAVSYLTITHKDTVNYDRSIVDSIKAGAYDWSNGKITDVNFPSSEKGTQEVEFGLFHFNRDISSEDAKAGMKAEGFRPATMKELLAYGEKHPEEPREFPIVALGSVAALGRYQFFGYLRWGSSERSVDMDYYDIHWNDNCRFLVVRI